MENLNNYLNNYLHKLYRTQNTGGEVSQRSLCSMKKYKELLDTVLDVLKENKDASIDELRNILYTKSGIDTSLKNFILERKLAPGAVISYGSPHFQETLVIGNQEEIKLENGTFHSSIKPMNEDTIFDLASCTKLFTALATLKLVEQKQIKLKDRIVKYAPQFEELKNVTVYDLLTFLPLETRKRIDSAQSVDEAQDILFKETVRKKISPVGNRYNDFAPIVLKYVIEGATGMKYKDFLFNEVLKDIGMESTYVNIDHSKLDVTANCNYDVRVLENNNIVMRDYNEPGISTDDKARILGQPQGLLSGHAGLFSTADDMTKLSRALSDGKIINPRVRDYMARNKTGIDYVDSCGNNKYTQYYGMLCYAKNPDPNLSEVYQPLSGKSFASAGWSGTQHTVDPVNGINLSFLSNRSHNRITYINPAIKEKVKTTANGCKILTLPNGTEMIDATTFAWDRDEITHKCLDLALQYKMLEDVTGYAEKEEHIEKSLRKIK